MIRKSLKWYGWLVMSFGLVLLSLSFLCSAPLPLLPPSLLPWLACRNRRFARSLDDSTMPPSSPPMLRTEWRISLRSVFWSLWFSYWSFFFLFSSSSSSFSRFLPLCRSLFCRLLLVLSSDCSDYLILRLTRHRTHTHAPLDEGNAFFFSFLVGRSLVPL